MVVELGREPWMLLPSIPSSNWARHGQMAKDSLFGQGVRRMVMMVAPGSLNEGFKPRNPAKKKQYAVKKMNMKKSPQCSTKNSASRLGKRERN